MAFKRKLQPDVPRKHQNIIETIVLLIGAAYMMLALVRYYSIGTTEIEFYTQSSFGLLCVIFAYASVIYNKVVAIHEAQPKLTKYMPAEEVIEGVFTDDVCAGLKNPQDKKV